MSRKRKFPADNPKKYWRTVPHTPQPPFLDLCEVDWHNLEEWWNHSRPRQKTRIPACQRYPKTDEPLKFMDRARHHTTRGRSKLERMMDRYWFVPIDDGIQYRELAYSKAIPPRRTTIYPPFLAKGRPKPKPKEEKTCVMCGGPFDAKRRDAKFCSAKCQKAAKRKAECPR